MRVSFPSFPPSLLFRRCPRAIIVTDGPSVHDHPYPYPYPILRFLNLTVDLFNSAVLEINGQTAGWDICHV